MVAVAAGNPDGAGGTESVVATESVNAVSAGTCHSDQLPCSTSILVESVGYPGTERATQCDPGFTVTTRDPGAVT